MKNNILIITVIVVIVAAGLGFVGGMKYEQMKLPTTVQNQGRFGMRRTGANNGMTVRGKVMSSDDTSVTVQLTDGSTKIVLVDSKTVYSQSATATKADVKDGENVAVFGMTNSDGSVTARAVQLGQMQ